MRMASFLWSIIGILAVGLCVGAGLRFGETALWGTVTAATTLYIGAIGIWVSRRGSSNSGELGDERIHSPSPVAKSASPILSASPDAREVLMKIGSVEYSELIHDLARRIDDPTEIIDIARRAGIRMSLLRSGGSQSPLSLWTTILTRAVRDGKVERLIAEAYSTDEASPGG